MADEYEGADAVRLYLTGASSDGGTQADPNASLGKYRSSTRLDSLGVEVTGGPSNITVVFASAENGLGDGTLTTKSADSMAWTPPGGAEGATVTIANGETKVFPGSDTDKFVVVTRDSATALSGNATLTLSDVFNNLWDNVADAERTAGDVEIRCVCLKNHSSSEIKSVKVWLGSLGTAAAVDASGYAASGAVTIGGKSTPFGDWPDSGFVQNDDTGEVLYYSSRTDSALTVPSGGRDVWNDVAGGAAGSEDDVIRPISPLRIGKEAPSAQPDGSFTDKSAGEGESVPVNTYHPTASDDANVIDIGDLAGGYIYALWVERKIVAGAVAEASVLDHIELAFESV